MYTKQVNAFYAYFILITTLASISICLLLGQPILYAFLIILGVSYIIGRHFGYSHKALRIMMYKGMRKVKVVIVMLSMVGMMISLWMQFGTIPALIFYGFKYLSNVNIVLAAFLISSIIAMVIGTAVGTLSITVPVFVGLAMGLHIPQALIVGALVSGAYLGDRTSPVSSSANLTAIVTDSVLIENVKKMLVTLLPTYLISLLIYYNIGSKYVADEKSIETVNALQILIKQSFSVNIMVFIPLIILLTAMILFKKSIVQALSYSLIATSVLLIGFNGNSLWDILYTAFMGYIPPSAEIGELVSGSGLVSMLNIFWIILTSTAFNGILEETKLIDPLLDKIKHGAHSPRQMMHRAGLLSVLVTLITCNQTLTAIITGNTFKESFETKGINTGYLARAISDFGMILVPIIPWNINAILVKSLTGVSAFSYAPLAYFCLLLPVMGFIYPYFSTKNMLASSNHMEQNTRFL